MQISGDIRQFSSTNSKYRADILSEKPVFCSYFLGCQNNFKLPELNYYHGYSGNQSWICLCSFLGKQELASSCTGGGGTGCAAEGSSAANSCHRCCGCLKPMSTCVLHHPSQQGFVASACRGACEWSWVQWHNQLLLTPHRKMKHFKIQMQTMFSQHPHLRWDPLVVWLRVELSEEAHIHLVRKISCHVQLFNVKA